MSALNVGIEILNCFSHENAALSQAALTRQVGRPKATVSRVMKVLRETGMLDYDSASRLYRPGIRLFALGQLSLSRQSFLDLIQKHLQHVCTVGGHTGYITVFDGPQLVVLRMVHGSSPVALAVRGSRVWPHASSNGRAMLALMTDKEWRKRVPAKLPLLSKSAPRTHRELAERIRQVRETGRSISSGDHYEGVSSQGIALRDPDNQEIFGIVVSYATSVATPELEEKIGALLDEMKREVQREVGLRAT